MKKREKESSPFNNGITSSCKREKSPFLKGYQDSIMRLAEG